MNLQGPPPRHRALKRLAARAVSRFEQDPDFQVSFHLAAMVFWIANAIVGTLVLVLFPHLWLTIGVYYVFLLSIYANWDTDYDAVSAAKAYKHARSADNKEPPK